MTITPTPITAALAGIVAAVAWPFVWARFGGSGGDVGLIVATLVVIAFPAHAFVVGFDRTRPGGPARGLDRALLVRIASWIVAALLASLVMRLLRA